MNTSLWSSQGPLQSTFGSLQRNFLSRLLGNVDNLRSLLEETKRETIWKESLHELRFTFHILAGGGMSYGFPRISEVSLAAETFIQELTDAGGPISKEAYIKLDNWIDAIETTRASGIPMDHEAAPATGSGNWLRVIEGAGATNAPDERNSANEFYLVE